MILKEIPSFERPREKAINEGVENLSNIELLAILLRTGSKANNVLDVAKSVIYKLNSLADFNELTIEELIEIKGIGKDKAITILASLEFAKRIINERKTRISFKSPVEVFDYFHSMVINLKQEHLYAIYLNAKGEMIAYRLITKGTINSTLVDSASIFKWGFKFSSSAVILIHNHPSGDPTPSIQDAKMTEEIIKQSKLLGLVIIDHIIIGETYYSMRKDGKYFKPF